MHANFRISIRTPFRVEGLEVVDDVRLYGGWGRVGHLHDVDRAVS